MKQEENNQIDTLLRNLARRQRAGGYGTDFPNRELAAQSAHLDVDELSSYAERALPPSARARCTAHLADCDDCRKIVAQLSLAAGPLTDEPRIAQSSAAGLTWAQKLSALFSPRMIRYAMPALALVLIAVAFFGWRQQREEKAREFVAVTQVSAPATATKAPGKETAAAVQPVLTGNKGDQTASERPQKETAARPAAAPTVAAESAKVAGESRDEKKASGVASDSTPASKTGKQDARAADKAAAAQPAYAPEPTLPSPKPQSVAANREQQTKNSNIDGLERGRETNVQQQNQQSPRKGPARNDNEVASQRGPVKGEAQAASKRKAEESGAAGGARNEDDEAETRTVAGRRFRRLSNAWVDTAYRPSMPIRGVTRGTEEYRALVADEPMIASIGNQLSGEVIVVWKSHAYRIN